MKTCTKTIFTFSFLVTLTCDVYRHQTCFPSYSCPMPCFHKTISSYGFPASRKGAGMGQTETDGRGAMQIPPVISNMFVDIIKVFIL